MQSCPGSLYLAFPALGEQGCRQRDAQALLHEASITTEQSWLVLTELLKSYRDVLVLGPQGFLLWQDWSVGCCMMLAHSMGIQSGADSWILQGAGRGEEASERLRAELDTARTELETIRPARCALDPYHMSYPGFSVI